MIDTTLTAVPDALLALCAASPAAAQELGEPMMLRLRDGSIRWGSLRGHDPRGLPLVAFGGAGGLQAAALARAASSTPGAVCAAAGGGAAPSAPASAPPPSSASPPN